jgi:molybdopterin converting factor subunit 1
MRVRVRLFAALREAVGRAEVDLDLSEGATAEDAWARLVLASPELAERRQSLSASVNRRYSPFDAPLHEGDEVVFIPPVSGG